MSKLLRFKKKALYVYHQLLLANEPGVPNVHWRSRSHCTGKVNAKVLLFSKWCLLKLPVSIADRLNCTKCVLDKTTGYQHFLWADLASHPHPTLLSLEPPPRPERLHRLCAHCTQSTITHITGGMEWMDHVKSPKKDVLGKRDRTQDLSDEVVISGTFVWEAEI